MQTNWNMMGWNGMVGLELEVELKLELEYC